MFHGTQFNCCVGRDSPQIDPVFNSQQGFRCRRVANPTFGESPNAERRVDSDFFCVVPVSFVKPLHSSCPVTQAREEHRQGTWLVECQCLRQYCIPTRNHLHRYYSHDAQRIGVVIPCIPGLKDLYLRLSECSITGAKNRLLVRATRQVLLARRNKWTVEAIPSNKFPSSTQKMDGTSDARSFVHSITLSIKFVGLLSPFLCCHVIECGLSRACASVTDRRCVKFHTSPKWLLPHPGANALEP
jgi:hypothetical protein